MTRLPVGYHDEPLGPPPARGVLGEARAAREVARLLVRAPSLRSAPRGHGEPVMLLPGYTSTDTWTAPLRLYLRWLGYRAAGWGLGTNHGDVSALLPQVVEAVNRLVQAAGHPVHLLGWSLGGVLAREAARERPDLVHQVITYGTPVVGGPAYTLARAAYGDEEVARIIALVAERNRVPLGVPVTAFYSRRDGVVSWRACIDTHTPQVAHIEVGSSHVGLGVDPDVWLEVARRLQAPAPRPAP